MNQTKIRFIGESTGTGYTDGIPHADDPLYSIPVMLQNGLNKDGHNCIVHNHSRASVTVDWTLGIKDNDESEWEPELSPEPPGSLYSLAKSPSDIAVIALGINDAMTVGLFEFISDFSALVDNCKSTGKKTFIVLPNEIEHEKAYKLCAVAGCMAEIGLIENVSVINSGLVSVPLCDGIHPTALGYQILAERIIPAVSKEVGSVMRSKSVVGMYIAMVNNGPEKGGLDYWANQLLARTPDQVAQSLIEATERHEAVLMTDGEFLHRVYSNLLNREPDPEGLAYWSEQIIQTSRGGVLNRIISAMESDGVPQVDRVTFQNKVSVSMRNGFVLGNPEKVDLVGVTSDFESVYNYQQSGK